MYHGLKEMINMVKRLKDIEILTHEQIRAWNEPWTVLIAALFLPYVYWHPSWQIRKKEIMTYLASPASALCLAILRVSQHLRRFWIEDE